jgi:hypothetical protein
MAGLEPHARSAGGWYAYFECRAGKKAAFESSSIRQSEFILSYLKVGPVGFEPTTTCTPSKYPTKLDDGPANSSPPPSQLKG